MENLQSAFIEVLDASKVKSLNLPSSVTKHFTTHLQSAGQPIDFECPECELTGPKIPGWINPIQFEFNLNSAIEAIEAFEGIFLEHRNLLLSEIQCDYFESEVTDPANIKKLKGLIGTPDYRSNLVLRLAKKWTEVIEYTKATRFGLDFCYGKKVSEVTALPGIGGVSIFRETVREIWEQYRAFQRREKQITIPINLRVTKDKLGNYITGDDAWESRDGAYNVRKLKEDNFNIDLTNYEPIKSLQFARLVDVGFRIVNQRSVTGYPAGSEGQYHFVHYDVRLTDKNDAMLLGSSASSKYEIGTIRISNVAGSNNDRDVKWSNYKSLINYKQFNHWSVNIGSPEDTTIRDCVLYLKIRYLDLKV